MGKLRVLDATGDTVVAWAPEDAEAVDQARAIFDRLVVGERRLAFAREEGAPSEDATQIRAFDPLAEEIIMVRPIQGG